MNIGREKEKTDEASKQDGTQGQAKSHPIVLFELEQIGSRKGYEYEGNAPRTSGAQQGCEVHDKEGGGFEPAPGAAQIVPAYGEKSVDIEGHEAGLLGHPTHRFPIDLIIVNHIDDLISK